MKWQHVALLPQPSENGKIFEMKPVLIDLSDMTESTDIEGSIATMEAALFAEEYC
jgi:hypothetical protein